MLNLIVLPAVEVSLIPISSCCGSVAGVSDRAAEALKGLGQVNECLHPQKKGEEWCKPGCMSDWPFTCLFILED